MRRYIRSLLIIVVLVVASCLLLLNQQVTIQNFTIGCFPHVKGSIFSTKKNTFQISVYYSTNCPEENKRAREDHKTDGETSIAPEGFSIAINE